MNPLPKTTFFLPSKDKTGRSVPAVRRAKLERAFAELLSNLHGGCTFCPAATGYWKNEAGELVIETVTPVFTFAVVPADEREKLALWIKDQYDQESVLVESPDGGRFF